MGTPDFAVPSLRHLHRDHEVLEVYTQPDRPSGRGRKLQPTPVKTEALALNLSVRQPVNFKDPIEVDHLASLEPDVICVAAYGLILPQAVLDVPRFGCINVHASILPRLRGAAPIHRAILQGDESAGVSIMRMEAGLDTGPFCRIAEIAIADHDVVGLTEELAELGAIELMHALDDIAVGAAAWTGQDESLVTYASKIDRSDVALYPGLTVEEALRRVRASNRQAASRARIDDTAMTVVEASPYSQSTVAAGDVGVIDGALIIGLSNGAIRLDRIRPEGRKTMDCAAFLCGARFGSSPTWEGLS